MTTDSATEETQATPAADYIQQCMDQTIEAFTAAELASSEEIKKTLSRHHEKTQNDEPADLIEVLARIQGASEDDIVPRTAEITKKIAEQCHPAPALIPFAGKLIAPSAFYESNKELHSLAKTLRAPVLYAEDSDAIGVSALNPIASMILAEAVRESVINRHSIRPFITSVRLDYESWQFLCRKHFPHD